WQEAAASDAGAAGKIARRSDAAGGRGELSDRPGQGAVVVTGRLSPGEVRAKGRDAADAAFDAARFQRRLPASVARERGEASWVDGWLNSSQPLPRELRAGAKRHQLGFGDLPAHRRHAAIGGRDDVAC